jgi:ATP-binding cassette subfamily C protein
MHMLQKIIALVDKETKSEMPVVLLLGLGASILEMIGLGILPVFVQLLADPDALIGLSYVRPLVDVFGLRSPSQLILAACLLLVMFFVLKTLYMTLVYRVQARFMRRVMVGVGNRMFDTYLYAPYTFHLHAKSGDIIRNVTHSPQYFAVSVVLSILKVFLHGIVTFGIVLLLLILHPEITLLALIVPAIVAWVFMSLIKKSTLHHGRSLQQALSYITSLTNHALGSIRETHVRGCHDFLRQHFHAQMDRLGAAHEFQKFAPVMAKPVMELFGVAVLVAMIVYFVLNGEPLGQALPVIVLFLAAISRLIQNIFPITQSLTSIRTYSYLVDALGSDIQKVDAEKEGIERPALDSGSKRSEPVRLAKAIEIRNLSFCYPGSDQDALRDISLVINHRTAVAFVGESGSGKTTLVDVILGLLTPQYGNVLVDGVDIQSNLHSWQRDIGYIPQTIYLLDESIRQNVAFGVASEAIDDKRVWEVLRVAQIDTFVRNLPEGLNTNVGERGVRISGGQRQRIGIARALYHSPDVLVMDEATSALDSVTENAVIQEISHFKERRTVIMVAHRLSTVKYCDTIFVLENGKVLIQGTYEELLANSRDFQRLANT